MTFTVSLLFIMSQTLGLKIVQYAKIPDLTSCLAVASTDLNQTLITET